MGIRVRILQFLGYLILGSIMLHYSRSIAEDFSSSERIDSLNWREYSEYLLEPLARYLDRSHVSLFYDTSDTRKAPDRKEGAGSADSSVPGHVAVYTGSLARVPFSSPDEMFTTDNILSGQKIFLNSQAVIEKLQGYVGLYRVIHDPEYSTAKSPGEMLLHQDRRVLEILHGSGRYEKVANEEDKDVDARTYRFIRFISPPAVRSVTRLFASTFADSQYAEENKRFSPVFSSCRTTHSENNSDDVFRFPLSFEDMHFFTNSLHTTTYRLLASKELFVPVTRVQTSQWKDFSTIVSSQVCSSQTFADGNRVMFERAPEFRDSSGKQKNTYTVRKEKVYILKATSMSPLSEGAYSYYIVGSETFLPYYKIQYDHGGEERRLIVANWGYPSGAETNNPLLVSLHSYDLTSEAMAAMEILAFTGEVAVDCFEEFYESVCPSAE
jgi:hypothetical protein